jgi:hypothetical protein
MNKLLISALALSPFITQACENPFVYNELPEVPVKGECGIEQFITQKNGRDLGAGYDGKYRALELETEFDFGLSTNDQIKLSIGHTMVHRGANNAFRFTGAQLGYLHVFEEAEKSDWGLASFIALGFEQVEAATGAIEHSTNGEIALFAQRNFGQDNHWSYVVNLGGEYSRLNESGESSVEYTLTQGIAYEFDPHWIGALEAVARAEYLEGKTFEWSGLFIGPTLTYNKKDISFSLGVLAQVVGNPREKGDLNVSNASPVEIRVKLGFEF